MKNIRAVTFYIRSLPRNVVLYLGGWNTAQIVKKHHYPARNRTVTPVSHISENKRRKRRSYI
jgi:hypothetical protein